MKVTRSTMRKDVLHKMIFITVFLMSRILMSAKYFVIMMMIAFLSNTGDKEILMKNLGKVFVMSLLLVPPMWHRIKTKLGCIATYM